MLKDFKLFSKLHAGYYDTQIREDEGSTKHICFVGQCSIKMDLHVPVPVITR